jgi:hypothetical protein
MVHYVLKIKRSPGECEVQKSNEEDINALDSREFSSSLRNSQYYWHPDNAIPRVGYVFSKSDRGVLFTTSLIDLRPSSIQP